MKLLKASGLFGSCEARTGDTVNGTPGALSSGTTTPLRNSRKSEISTLVTNSENVIVAGLIATPETDCGSVGIDTSAVRNVGESTFGNENVPCAT